ncbi:UUP1 family membrane protein [Orrella sp. 11846]|uniref:UUP1 family membrane protein n=1 Tax=Orrella sp. 11846 TaxID=3409913 RepID=UPI003B58BAB9
METRTVHWLALIILLTLSGALLTAHQIFVLKLPLTQSESDTLWNIDAKVTFIPTRDYALKVQMKAPPLRERFVPLNESFVSPDYGVSVDTVDGNRMITWAKRKASGPQTLFYRLTINDRYGDSESPEEGPVYREAIETVAPEKVAVDALLGAIRSNSADVDTFVGEAIQRLNQNQNEHVRVLLGPEADLTQKIDVLEVLLSQAHIPIERVHVLVLDESRNAQMTQLIRTFNGQKWLYFNPQTGARGLANNQLIWWFGDEPLVTVEGGRQAQVEFAVNHSAINAMRLGQTVQPDNSVAQFLGFSLYGLPLTDQMVYKLIVMIPLGVLLVLLLRNLIGIQTLGTFTPVLIGMAFRETGLGMGILYFTVITFAGLMLRSYLDYLKLQLLPRLSVVLTFVVILMASISLISHKLDLSYGLSVSLFPMVILTMTIERLSIAWDERGGHAAVKLGIITLVAAAGAFWIMSQPELQYFVFTFPGTLLMMMAVMLLMGRYRGYRLTELFRFRAMIKD